MFRTDDYFFVVPKSFFLLYLRKCSLHLRILMKVFVRVTMLFRSVYQVGRRAYIMMGLLGVCWALEYILESVFRGSWFVCYFKHSLKLCANTPVSLTIAIIIPDVLDNSYNIRCYDHFEVGWATIPYSWFSIKQVLRKQWWYNFSKQYGKGMFRKSNSLHLLLPRSTSS